MGKNNSEITRISEKLLEYLQVELNSPEIAYQTPLIRLQGGYETAIYQFQLKGAADDYIQPLVLRLYPAFYGPNNASWEGAVQNVLANEGYPAAKVHFVCTDMSVLGGAFCVMDYVPGRPLMFAPPAVVPGILGTTHAALHQIDPAPLVSALTGLGFDEDGYRLASGFEWMQNMVGELPWIGAGVDWLLQNRPAEPQHLSVCHGDFHALNILFKDGAVTGVLDWGGFRIADPAFDVANTIVLTTIPAKHLSANWEGIPPVDWDLAAALYISEYQKHKNLDHTNLDFYKVRRCVLSLIQGAEGQQVWQHPPIVRDLIDCIYNITGIQISRPEQTKP